VVAALAVTAVGVAAMAGSGSAPAASTRPRPARATTTTSTTIPAPTTTTAPPVPVSIGGILRPIRTITGDIAPKSVVATGTGLVFAQNMMYRHSMTVYDATGTLVATIDDSVDLAAFGIAGHPGVVRGAPVEVAFSPDRAYAYVSNYSMYGAGFGPEGKDACSPSSGYGDSYAYRVSLATMTIDQVIAVGSVPKYVAVTPDGRYALVSNWCSYDLSVIDTALGVEVQRVPIGPTPRGIVVSPDSTTAYVAVMGTSDIAVVDLTTFGVGWIKGVGSGPRHVVLDPTGRFLFATLNYAGEVVSIDVTTRQVVARTRTGQSPRSMAISADGLSLYVVNYDSNTISKLSAGDLSIQQTVDTPSHPIGITYDQTTGNVWVASYAGSILLYSDTP